MRKFISTLMVVLGFVLSAAAQNRTVTGMVTDDKNAPLQGVSVTSTDGKYGTQTDKSGRFSLTLPTAVKTLLFSYVNHEPAVKTISGNEVNASLASSDKKLEEVVVTALGIVRDKKSLGYATQNIKGDQLANRGATDIVSSLQGKVSGVDIVGAGGAPGASVNINIRGIQSFNGSNQPLFVIDGIPVSNDVDTRNAGSLGTLGNDQSNRALDIDPNNIESVNILKGPAAAALYGSRASSGAIIITTKKGSGARGRVDITLNSNYSYQYASGLPKFQNQYGQGANGVYAATQALSFGPAFGSTPTLANGLLTSTGAVIPYKAFPSNYNDFFDVGTTWDNNLSINSGDAKQNASFSIGNVNQKGILPNTKLDRTNVSFGMNTVIKEKLTVGGKVTFTNTAQTGVLTGNGNSALGRLISGLPRNLDVAFYKKNYKNPDGTNNWPIAGQANPAFYAYENPVTSNVTRVNGNINLGLDLTSWLNVGYRLGVDAYTDRKKQIFAIGTIGQNTTGTVAENSYFRSEINGDLLISAKTNNFFTRNIKATLLLGQNVNQRRYQRITSRGDQLSIPNFYNVSNASVFTNSGEFHSLQRLLGFYAQTSFSFKDYLFLELTGRADKSSTLPKDNALYFYPAISTSFVITDAIPSLRSDILSYAKIRANYAKVGKDADPYILSNSFVKYSYGNNVASNSFPLTAGGIIYPGFGAASTIASNTLSPEFTTSSEFGVNLGFWKNRVNLDVTYFNSVSKDQILQLTIPTSTGFDSRWTNAGKMTNKGIEVLLNVAPVITNDFRWDITANFSHIKNNVEYIAPGVTSSSINGSGFTGSIASFMVGQPYGIILGNKIPTNAAGQRLVDSTTGLYKTAIANSPISNPNPDFTLGVTNSFKYKGIYLSFLVDYRKGSDLLSFSSALFKSSGVLDITGIDRDKPKILQGVIETAPGKYRPNNIQIPAQTYWNSGSAYGGLQTDLNVYDASVIRLRELSFGYDVPASALPEKMFVKGIRFGVFGRNLWYYAPQVPIDPEVNSQGAGNIRGLELQSGPNTRTIGANIKFTF
ncbi:MAG: TonB-dependent receptor plug [Ferruginibacter sp.]|nr:TonB-dependent receptor plug [Ferruginibacter sp.]